LVKCSKCRPDPGIHLAQALGYEAIKRGHSVRYISIFELVRELMDDEPEPGKLLNKYLKPDLLIIDDMGLKQLPARAGEHLFEIIMRRYELRSTLMTSNRPIEDWGQLIGDVPAAGAILDRLLQRAEIIPFKGLKKVSVLFFNLFLIERRTLTVGKRVPVLNGT
jgi:DNA replication protein DnaC